MKKKIGLLMLLLMGSLLIVSSAFAHTAPPCNDTNGSGSPSGLEYAKHHIVPMAKANNLGDGGHKPGVSHQGFSACQQ
jgi:hypothetical protein